jgi:hypothetical protein
LSRVVSSVLRRLRRGLSAGSASHSRTLGGCAEVIAIGGVAQQKRQTVVTPAAGRFSAALLVPSFIKPVLLPTGTVFGCRS